MTMKISKHLKDNNMGYFHHMLHAWSMALALIIHGVFPWILGDWVSKKLCKDNK